MRDCTALAEHAVIVHLRLSQSGFGSSAERQRLAELEKRLDRSIKNARAGEFDGNEFVREAATQAGSFVVKRRGAADDPNAKDEKIQL